MARELMGYRFKGSGFDAPEEKRKYEEPDKRLQEAFEKWLSLGYKRDEYKYDAAIALTKKTKRDIGEAHSLLIRYPDKSEGAGIFLSAIYNKAPERCIIYDLDLPNPPMMLGYRLRKDKILVNKGTVESALGVHSQGVIINCGTAKSLAGINSDALVINYGDTYMGLGAKSKGIVINCGTTTNISDANIVIAVKNPDQIANLNKFLPEHICRKIPELIEYLEEIRKRTDTVAALKELGNNPKKTIEDRIKDILKRAGHEI